MIRIVPSLSRLEHDALASFVGRLLASGSPPLERAMLFGSKARGDDDPASDIDVLLIVDIPVADRDLAASHVGDQARRLAASSGVIVEPWVVPVADLEEGGRTPMLVDALEDSLPLWPVHAPPIRLPFTPSDALFCAECLLDWVEEGQAVVEDAMRRGHARTAATRARDDITRLATAALLLDGETRHRRIGSLRRFESRFVATRRASPTVLPALAWAEAAFPPDGGRGEHRPRITRHAIATAHIGSVLAHRMYDDVTPLVLEQMLDVSRAPSP